MLDAPSIYALVREAQPRDFKMLRSYVRWSPTVEYARRVMIPALRRLLPRIWTHLDSKPFNSLTN